MEWTTAIVLGISIIAASVVGSQLIEALFDKLIPERLERFKLETYKSGVQDATRKVVVNKE